MADHVGVYAISASFLPSPATVPSKDVTPNSILVNRIVKTELGPGGSTVVTEVIPASATLVSLGNETTVLNAMQSGSEVIETGSYGETTIPLYYSKAVRFDHQKFKHPASLQDLFNNIPKTAPTSSVSGSTAVYKKYIGYLSGTISVGAGVPGPFQVVLANSADQSAIISASVGNIVYVTSGAFTSAIAVYTATNDNSADKVLFFPLLAQPRQPVDGYDWASGSVTIHSWVPMSSSVSGVYLNTTFYDPADINIPVTSSGRIRDLRVWVELVHDYRNVSQSQAYAQSGLHQYAWGLQSLQLALRSPNTNFRAAHPTWNAAGATALPIRTQTTLTGTNNRFGSTYTGVPELLRNSYLLWAGHDLDEGPRDLLGDTTPYYHEYDFDIDMRTVFWDGSSFRNPRDLSLLHPEPGVTQSWISLVSNAASGAYPSPSAYVSGAGLTQAAQQLHFNVSPSGVITGSDVPWIIDSRLDSGNVWPTGTYYARAVQSVPPDGWLTAATASVKGWQSTFISSSSGRLFKSGRLVVRPTTNQVYMLGGEGINGDSDTSCSNYVAVVPFYVDRSVEQVTLNPGTILQNSVLPMPLSKMGLAYYTSSLGEHVIMVGGKTGTLDATGSTTVYVGDFRGTDISWASATSYQLPSAFPMYDCFVHVVSGTIYALGGYSSGAFNPDVWEIPIDASTGRPTGSWSIAGTSCTLRPINSSAVVAGQIGDQNWVFVVGYSGSQDIAQIAHVSGAFQLAFTINSASSPVPTGSSRYPLAVSSMNVFAVFASASNSSGTWAAPISSDGTPLNIHSASWSNVGTYIPSSAAGNSGTTVSYGNIVFVGCGNPTGTNDRQLFASTFVVEAADLGEFPTRGQQIGPSSMRPVYSLLDDVYSLKIYDQPPSLISPNHGDIRGFRPGLRGTECSGSWDMMIGMSAQAFDPVSGSTVEPSVGVWLRQVRLEFVVDHGIGLNDFYPSRSRKWTRAASVPGPVGFQGVAIVSGAAAWDIGLNQTQVSQSPDYGRAVGITDATGSTPTAAIQTFITGDLYTLLSGSGIVAPSWFLNGNGFGTPYIPDSSMSLGLTGSAEEIDASASQELYRRTVGQTTLIPNANTLTDYLRRVNYSQTTQQIAEDVAVPASGGYFGF